MDNKPLLVDAHEDLAYNMLTFGRNYTLPVTETRRIEKNSDVPVLNGDSLLGWDAYQEGNVVLIFGTLFAAPIRHQVGPWDVLCYETYDEARSLHMRQINAYYELVDEHADKFQLVVDKKGLYNLRRQWDKKDYGVSKAHRVGVVLLMEGAESVRSPDELDEWWQLGVRIIGLAWAGTRFCGGTKEPGPLTKDGYSLLDGMADLGFCLDLSHMDETAVLQALDHFPGCLLVSHANAKALLKGAKSNRFLSDREISGVVERGGVIGVTAYNRFLTPGWVRGDARELGSLEMVANHIDHICQIAGNAHHAAIGSDFDGGFGLDCVPPEVDSIADLQKLTPILTKKGYTRAEIDAVLGLNWLNLLAMALPG
jgi:membrane dipeptidase